MSFLCLLGIGWKGFQQIDLRFAISPVEISAKAFSSALEAGTLHAVGNDVYQIRRPLGLVFVIYFWWLGELLLFYI